MQQFPNYLMNQQMIQPNMAAYQNFNPAVNPYMDRMAQLQQYQQNLQMVPAQMSGTSQQPQGLIGKVVNDVSMVSPNDVPMDGNVALFPKTDMSEIYCKQWKQDGTIQTVIYRPYIEQDKEQAANIPQSDFNALNNDMRAFREEILGKLDGLEGYLANIGISQSNSAARTVKNQPKGKKEVNIDE